MSIESLNHEQFTVSNNDDGFDLITAELRKHSVTLVLMEATGGLEASVACSSSG